MRMRMIMGALLVLVLIASSAVASTIPVKGDQTKMEMVTETKAGLNYQIQIGQLEGLNISTKGGDFTRLLIPGFHSSKVEGQPELPMMNRLISIPLGADAQVSVSNVQTRLISLADYGFENAVFPAQPSLSKSEDASRAPFIHDAGSYRGEVRRDIARIVTAGRMRAMDIGRLEISPVAYYPSTNSVEVVESMDVSITFVGANKAAADDLRASTWSPFFSHLYAGIDGSKGFHDDYPDRVGDIVTMVIVTPPMFASQLEDFIQWKTDRGFNMITAVTGTPEVGTTTSSIQSYLHGLFNNATPEMPAPSFVLFVGDIAQMPTFTEGGNATDRPYCAVDGDLVPEMFYGRFSATNPGELQAQIDKTMTYDQFTMADPSYMGNVTMIAGVDGSWAPTHGNGQINYGTEHYFNAAHGINSNTFLYPDSDAASAPAAVLQTINDGIGFINYTAHGSETSWSDPSMSQSDLRALTNDGEYMLSIGNCCSTSTYDYGECMGETWLRVANKGAIGYIGGSNSTYWHEDYWFGVGFHAQTEIDGTAYPYEATGLGAYDGVFHENGEAEILHYVTNDAIIFSGNLAVMESGSTRIEYYWNIYNLLGDPSLSTYMGVPAVNPVMHPETVFVGLPTMNVDAAIGTYVGLTQDGVLVGSGTVDASGSVEIAYNQILTPGVAMKMVAMAQNMEPYIVDLNVIVPATITIEPMVIDANVDTDLTITVMDAEGTTPQAGIEIWAESLGYPTVVGMPVIAVTDANGIAVLTVNSQYGPTMDIVGKDPAESYLLFTEPIAVNALDLDSPDLTVSTNIGLVDAFALNLEGTLTATVAELDHNLIAVLPDGSVLGSGDTELNLTPAQLGNVTGLITVSGYNIYTEEFEIIEAYGTVAGNVVCEGVPMGGVVVNGVDDLGGNVFSVVTNASGDFVVAEELLVDDYTIEIDHFGYLAYELPIFVGYGANNYPVELTAAPSGILSGNVVDSVTLEGLEGIVRVYRTDTGELYTEAACDETGAFATSALPYFTYTFKIRAYHHKPVTLEMAIEQPETVKDFALEATNGDLLLVDDGGAKGMVADKFGGKRSDVLLARGYMADESKSAAELSADLEDLGYSVTVVAVADVELGTLGDYDIVVLSCGNNTSTLEGQDVFKAAMVEYVNSGGHVLLEGGELGYDQYGSGAFAADVMHTEDWNHDSSGVPVVSDSEAYILNNPNVIASQIPLTYVGYGDSDAMAPLAGAAMPMAWTNYLTDASVLTYDANADPRGGQMVFMTFNYAAAGEGVRDLLQNSVEWLLALEIGDCSISGQAMMEGETSHAGIVVTAMPGGITAVTAADGTYVLPNLYAGDYTISVDMLGFAAPSQAVTLAEGQNMTDVSFVMAVVYETEVCGDVALSIPDNNETGVSTALNIDFPGEVTGVSVFVDITHTYIGDLTLTLTSPAGTPVELQSSFGGSADDILGWYPGDFEVSGDLSTFVGEDMMGDWTLTVVDGAGQDVGAINNWCVKVGYRVTVPVGVQEMSVDGGSAGMVLSWSYDPQLVDGFNVYRRVAGENSVRLNSELVVSSSGTINFVDNGNGLTTGQTVFYRYVIVVDGAELGGGNEVQIEYASVLPAVYALHANYPNPFNPITNISFDMPRSGHVKLVIYDISGRLVKTMVDEVRSANSHTETWDGTDRGGRRVASGTYYYRLITPTFTDTQKMMLVK